MRDPVVDIEGHSFERAAVLEWITAHQTSAMSRTPMRATDLVPNRALKAAIDEFLSSSNISGLIDSEPPQSVRSRSMAAWIASLTDGELDVPAATDCARLLLDQKIFSIKQLRWILEQGADLKSVLPAFYAEVLTTALRATGLGSINGWWTGQVSQLDSDPVYTYSILLFLDGNGGTVDYPELEGGGTVTKLVPAGAEAARVAAFQEAITYGSAEEGGRVCDGGCFTVHLVDGRLHYSYSDTLGYTDAGYCIAVLDRILGPPPSRPAVALRAPPPPRAQPGSDEANLEGGQAIDPAMIADEF